MSILSGFEKYKRHLKVDDENYKLVSEWTHSDTVEMNDGKSLTETITSLKNQTSSFIGNEYSSSATYKIGDYCVYADKWYKCIVDITTPETWNSNHWTLTNISDEVTEVQELGQYIRYNQTDETIQVLNNDKWVDIKSVGFTKKDLLKSEKIFISETGGINQRNKIDDYYNFRDGHLTLQSNDANSMTNQYGTVPNFYTYDSVSFFGFSKLIINWSAELGASLVISKTPDFSEFIVLASHDDKFITVTEEISLGYEEEPGASWSYWDKYFIGFAAYGESGGYPNHVIVRQLLLTV